MKALDSNPLLSLNTNEMLWNYLQELQKVTYY
ncbi:uncharacterized protein METZ01_LOCUS51285 [marine metagenome]|uniref:Uncharacterized protein n=1 Tax=marine metagenome TaxID=408172 RepID=A0A381S542_9ZZZZ